MKQNELRDRRIINWRDRGWTYREIAEKFDLSIARIRQIVYANKKRRPTRRAA